LAGPSTAAAASSPSRQRPGDGDADDALLVQAHARGRQLDPGRRGGADHRGHETRVTRGRWRDGRRADASGGARQSAWPTPTSSRPCTTSRRAGFIETRFDGTGWPWTGSFPCPLTHRFSSRHRCRSSRVATAPRSSCPRWRRYLSWPDLPRPPGGGFRSVARADLLPSTLQMLSYRSLCDR
jgi:hypothetical protein